MPTIKKLDELIEEYDVMADNSRRLMEDNYIIVDALERHEDRRGDGDLALSRAKHRFNTSRNNWRQHNATIEALGAERDRIKRQGSAGLLNERDPAFERIRHRHEQQ